MYFFGFLVVSIRAPVRGRPPDPASRPLTSSFNPRPREGATLSPDSPKIDTQSFNPRPREGATDRTAEDGQSFRRVSIRAPVRGRHLEDEFLRRSGGFNPRPREGATKLLNRLLDAGVVSIRAPVRGRPELDEIRIRGGVSIRAPVRGRRCRDRWPRSESSVSIRAPVRGRPWSR